MKTYFDVELYLDKYPQNSTIFGYREGSLVKKNTISFIPDPGYLISHNLYDEPIQYLKWRRNIDNDKAKNKGLSSIMDFIDHSIMPLFDPNMRSSINTEMPIYVVGDVNSCGSTIPMIMMGNYGVKIVILYNYYFWQIDVQLDVPLSGDMLPEFPDDVKGEKEFTVSTKSELNMLFTIHTLIKHGISNMGL